MPFTVSHIAAVLPGHRAFARAGILSAAVIGSMVPDFGLLLPGSLARWQTHSAEALLTFCLPVGLATYWLLQRLIKPAMLQIMPDRAYLRLRAAPPSAAHAGLRGWLYAAVAILLGATTHLIWDAFTHENARGVRMFPVLEEYGPELDGHPLRYYHWLQHGSSVAGLILVVIALALWWRHAPRPTQPPSRAFNARERGFWAALYVLLPLAAVAAAILHVHRWEAFRSSGTLAAIAIAGMRGCALSLLGVSLLILARLAGRATPA